MPDRKVIGMKLEHGISLERQNSAFISFAARVSLRMCLAVNQNVMRFKIKCLEEKIHSVHYRSPSF